MWVLIWYVTWKIHLVNSRCQGVVSICSIHKETTLKPNYYLVIKELEHRKLELVYGTLSKSTTGCW